MPRSLSDHNLILLSEEGSVRLPWPFKFFSHWADRLELVEVVKNLTSMNLGEGAGNLLRAIKVAVKSWVKEFKKADGESVMNIENKISKLEGEAVKTRNNDIVRKDIQALRSDLWAKYRREEKEWLQKSRLKWFKDGDKNTSFLHTFASVRNKANHISVIKMDQNTTSDQKSISEAFVKHFREFYNETPTIELKRFEVEFRKLSKSSILLLEAPFTEEEVWSAINSADGSRAPGPDRFNLDFYKRFWASIKSEVTAFFGNFFEGKVSDKSINHSFSPNPKAGKQITDCALIANEMIDYLRRNNFAAVMVKADFKKAYDTIDWNFLNLILQKMVFDNRWREWVRFCISSASISVLINGSPSRAELAAIMEAIKIFKSSRWVKLYKLIIESDSLLSVRWIENPRIAPSNFTEIVSNCAALCTPCSWEVRFVFRERNVDAHSLAQAGVGRQIPFVWFAPVG
ncbi:hypothetical protein GQ457_11G030490 [Hibiscus cannabinus]